MALVAELELIAKDVSASLFLKTYQKHLDPIELESTLRLLMPSVVFLDVTRLEMAEMVCAIIRKNNRNTQIIGFARDVDQSSLLMAVRCGLRDVMVSPLSPSTVHSSLERAYAAWQEEHKHTPREHRIISFLPSKIGSGASTVALQTSVAISRSGLGRTTLIDMDFDCGSLDFMLKLPYDQGVSHLCRDGIGDRGVCGDRQ
jgi:Flp pilus assembly CpaE family ATPase